MSTVIGIDLGATNIHVAVAQDGVAQSVPSRTGRSAIPAVVAETGKGRLLSGELARRQAITNAEATVTAGRRLLGLEWDVDAAADLRRATGCSFVAGPSGDLRVSMPHKIYTPQELVAATLEEARKAVQAQVGRVLEAAISVPPYFDERQRRGVLEAATFAGLKVLGLIEEPAAAAIAYGLHEQPGTTIGVYDIGGRSFDFAILVAEPSGLLRLLDAVSDSALGGGRLDRWILDKMVEVLEGELGLEPRSDPMSMQRLTDAAEAAKRKLSEADETEIFLPFQPAEGRAETHHLKLRLSRGQLAEASMNWLRATMDHCERSLSAAGLDPQSLDEAVLAGGMTKAPWVRTAARELFLRPPMAEIPPDVVISHGAALHAERLAKGTASGLVRAATLPHGLGLLVGGAGADELFPLGTDLPASISRSFTTGRDGQPTFELVLVRTSGAAGVDGGVHRRLEVRGLRPAPRGQVEVHVTFAIDAAGEVAVTAVDAQTGQAYVVAS